MSEKKKEKCVSCGGSGQIDDGNHPGGSASGPNWITCPTCGGSGTKTKEDE